jgi:hypothetical protein
MCTTCGCGQKNKKHPMYGKGSMGVKKAVKKAVKKVYPKGK